MPERHPEPEDVSVRQFVADSGKIARGLRQGRLYTLTLNGEPLAEMIPTRKRRAVPAEEVLAVFATAPVLDWDEVRADLDDTADAGHSGSSLRAALEGVEPPDARFTEEINAALSLLTSEETDPWADA